MPPKPVTDPIALEERKSIQREKQRTRTARHRLKTRTTVEALLSTALATVTDPLAPRSAAQGLAAKTARALLKNSLERNGVTVERIVRTVSEGLDSTKVIVVNGEERLLPDMQSKLRTITPAITLLERAGELPTHEASEGGSGAYITVNVLVMPEKP